MEIAQIIDKSLAEWYSERGSRRSPNGRVMQTPSGGLTTSFHWESTLKTLNASRSRKRRRIKIQL